MDLIGTFWTKSRKSQNLLMATIATITMLQTKYLLAISVIKNEKNKLCFKDPFILYFGNIFTFNFLCLVLASSAVNTYPKINQPNIHKTKHLETQNNK